MKFLVVDDSRVVRKFVIKCLGELGFTEIEEAEDGSVALASVKREMPAVILLDWNMPVMDGLTFIKLLRPLPGGDNPIVIFCTTENEIDKITQALSSSANEYIMKPFDTEVLRGKFYQLGIIGD